MMHGSVVNGIGPQAGGDKMRCRKARSLLTLRILLYAVQTHSGKIVLLSLLLSSCVHKRAFRQRSFEKPIDGIRSKNWTWLGTTQYLRLV
jgi:hypothetical protein